MKKSNLSFFTNHLHFLNSILKVGENNSLRNTLLAWDNSRRTKNILSYKLF